MDGASYAEAARRWVGTPHRHQGRRRGKTGSADCVAVVMESAREVGILPADYDTPVYGERDTWKLAADWFEAWAVPIPKRETRAGDVLIFRPLGGDSVHMGVLYEYEHGGLGIVHASDETRVVVEHRLSEEYMRLAAGEYRPRAFLSING